jgi:hypothetical protein
VEVWSLGQGIVMITLPLLVGEGGTEWFLKLLNLSVEGVLSETERGGGVGVVIEIGTDMEIGIGDEMIGIGIGMIGGIVIDVIAIVTGIGIGNVRGKVIEIETEIGIGRGIERGIEVECNSHLSLVTD